MIDCTEEGPLSLVDEGLFFRFSAGDPEIYALRDRRFFLGGVAQVQGC